MDCQTNNGNDSASAGIARSWDAEYESGRYEGEPPVPFTDTITSTLRVSGWTGGRGLYVGCGNGRNYAPLAAACPGLRGIDLSEVGIRRLLEKHPEYAGRVSRGDFFDGRCYAGNERMDYLVSIQSFQHGGERQAARYLERAAAVLRPGGLLFLRVNSAGTDVRRPHEVTEENAYGGFTVRYAAGPKKGLCVHFFGRRELLSALRLAGFEPTLGPARRPARRGPPGAGIWEQWEVVAVRRAP